MKAPQRVFVRLPPGQFAPVGTPPTTVPNHLGVERAILKNVVAWLHRTTFIGRGASNWIAERSMYRSLAGVLVIDAVYSHIGRARGAAHRGGKFRKICDAGKRLLSG